MNSDTLIRTKLQRPTIGPDILPRTQLIKRLEDNRYRKLTLLSAPAGYGKSILASLWQEACDCHGTWLTLDENDNNLGVFVHYFIGAIQTIFPESFSETGALLNGQKLPPVEILSTRLVNEVVSVSQPFMFVLDDYHVIRNQDIHQLLDKIICYLPAQMHLVLITRQDPSLNLVNLRANSQVTEFKLADLRFNEEEVLHYLDIKLGDHITPTLARELIQRTEGWAVGLRLAVLALRHQVDPDRFLENFQGTDPNIMGYLVSEVLSQQPQPVQKFLLQTSLLDRFSVLLCDALRSGETVRSGGTPGSSSETAVAEKTGSQEIIDRLQRDNLFLIPLYEDGEWFRYHHLFQDLLRHQLRSAISEEAISQIHLQASLWFAGQGFIEEALDHAFRANDMDLAAQVVAQARYGLISETQWQRLEQLLRRFPPDIIGHYPELLMAESWLLHQHNQWTKLPAKLERLDKLINQSLPEEDYGHLQGEISALLSLLLYYALDIAGAKKHAEQALKLTAPELGIVRVLARLMLAGTQLMASDLNAAYGTIYRSFDDEPDQSNILKATVLATSCFVGWIAADIKTLQQNATQAINLAQIPRSPGMLGYGNYFLGMAAYHQNDLSAAEEHFSFVTQRPYATYDDSYCYSACGLALTYQALNRGQDALDVVDAALAYFLVTGNNELLPVLQAFQSDLALRQKQLHAASQWANQLDPLPPLSPMTQFYDPHMTLVKVWLAENTSASRENAAALLGQLKEFLESTHNTVFLIETLALQSILYQMDGDESAALNTLEQAFILALPGNFIRLFVDLGPVMGNLLYKLIVQEPELSAYKSKILSAMALFSSQASSSLQDENGSPPLVKPLTNREMEVLILLVQGQTDKEIAAGLTISHHTVRSHTKNIYAKLGVKNRRQAAIRAQELGLVSSI